MCDLRERDLLKDDTSTHVLKIKRSSILLLNSNMKVIISMGKYFLLSLLF